MNFKDLLKELKQRRATEELISIEMSHDGISCYLRFRKKLELWAARSTTIPIRKAETLRPRDELVELAWAAQDGLMCLAHPGIVGRYIEEILWGPASDLDSAGQDRHPPAKLTARRRRRSSIGQDHEASLGLAYELFASAALSMAAGMGADIGRGTVIEKVRTFKRQGKQYRAMPCARWQSWPIDTCQLVKKDAGGDPYETFLATLQEIQCVPPRNPKDQ